MNDLAIRLYASFVIALAAAPVLARDKPLYAPAPAWVVPAPPVDPAKLGPDGSPIVVLDQQQRLDGGTVTTYVDSASRIQSEQALSSAGTIKLQWQPDSGDLVVHRITILRGADSIDLLAAKDPFTILRRESGLEQLMIDGVLTATMPVTGLRIGDVLRVSYSVTHSDPVLKGAMQSTAGLLGDQSRADFARVRLLWNAATDVRWQALAKTGEARLSKLGETRELTLMLPLPKQPDLPGDVPQRFRPLPIIEVSTFKDWADVARVMAPLYRPHGLITAGGALAGEVARIAGATSDPRTRTALALRLVQSEVRYLFNGLDNGNYVPQSPEKTWVVRYGDCKAKTLLLLALLDALGVKAEAVMAHTQLGDHVPRRLPSAAAFNHVLVHATIAGQDYWLDGTGTGTRAADLGDTPNLRNVLPVRDSGAALVSIAGHANARPNIEVHQRIDQRAGIGIVAPFSADVVLHGALAENINAGAGSVSGEKRKEALDGIVSKLTSNSLIVSRSISYDPDTATTVIHATGLTAGNWRRSDRRFEWTLDKVVGDIKFDGDRARPEWRELPVRTGDIASALFEIQLVLPDGGKGFVVEGDRTLASIAGADINRSFTQVGDTVTLSDRADETAREIKPADVAAIRAGLALAKTRRLKVKAPADYPKRWQVIRAAQARGLIAPIEAAYATLIAEAADKTDALGQRADFRRSIQDRKGAIADLDQLISTRPDVDAYLARAALHYALKNDARALADTRAAYALDPGAQRTLMSLAEMEGLTGQRAAAVARLQERIDAGGENVPDLLSAKADIEMTAGDAEAALASIAAAIAAKPGDSSLLNARCWIKATLSVQLDTALKDCTKAIELGDSATAALDSRSMVYFKLGRLDDALIDIDAALDQAPELAASRFMRGIIAQRQGRAAEAADDLAAARFASPRIDEQYARYGVKAAVN
jgi:tetratricopeptide (TPR) repeat protein